MRIPEELAELGKKRISNFPVEGFVYGSGPKHPKFMLVGEAPGETEIGNGIPFSGRAGKELMKFLEMAGVSRDEVYITSAVRSRPYKWGEKRERNGDVIKRKYNRPPTKREILAHAPILDYETLHVQAPLIVTLGNVGLKRLLGPDYSVTTNHGQFINSPILRLASKEWTTYEWSEKNYLIFPTFHPASIFYNPSLRALIQQDMEKLKIWLQQGE
ncbi:uracil-DNA glycosylase [Peribacillus acanthi]|uniref:uracil-DNA glycosylase n=1 Tax=Peribacillus acanthi TaxID=2171554 RepID=UPI000D3E0E61|nr:uracil-DNA glycosylase [Peribacillus acanthi]